MEVESSVARPVTRRDFLKGSAALVAGMLSGAGVRASEEKRTRVVLVRDPGVIDENWKVNRIVLEEMLDEAVTVLLDADGPSGAWKMLVSEEDVVGIKSNEWSFLPTPPELEGAIESRILDAGVPEENVSIDDRGVLRNPVFARTTALVNVRPIRTHYWAGIGGCIKNYIMFAPNPPDYHHDACTDLALLWRLRAVRGKTRLNILSLLNPLFHGKGPHHFDRRYVWRYCGLLVGTDPVAVDSVGLRVIRAKRKEFFGRDPGWETLPRHVLDADRKHGLGVSDPESIELVKLGWMEDVLI